LGKKLHIEASSQYLNIQREFQDVMEPDLKEYYEEEEIIEAL